MKLLSRLEAAKELSLSIGQLDRLLNSGELPSLRIGRRVLLNAQHVIGWRALQNASPESREIGSWLAANPTVATGVVYFVRSLHLAKIGYSTLKHLNNRMCNMRTDNPHGLEWLCAMPGSLDLERKIHVKLLGQRVQGEWFTLDGPVRSFVSAIVELSGSQLQVGYREVVGGAIR